MDIQAPFDIKEKRIFMHKKILCLILFCMLINISSYAAEKPLFVADGMITDGEKEVVLNGVNLGGWMIMELWMSPIKDENQELAYSDIQLILKNRFGTKKANELLNAYKDNYITEKDFENIKKLGFNCVRLPFWYKNFINRDGGWINNSFDNNPGFKRLDWVIEQCRKNGLWLILDMHGCPGGQSMNHSTGTIGKNELYDSEANLKYMEKIWVAIAKRYKNEDVIAAYDIMNEPQNNGGYSGERAWQAESREAVEHTNMVYDRMIKAIRKTGDRHIITVEGVWTIDVLPNPKDMGWDNMMYQLHIYDNNEEMIKKRIKELTDARDNYSVAVYVGEYHSPDFERYSVDLYQSNNISRTKWTYKIFGNTDNNWGLYNNPIEKINIRTASYAKIKNVFEKQTRTENGFFFNKEEYERIKFSK